MLNARVPSSGDSAGSSPWDTNSPFEKDPGGLFPVY